MTRDELVQAIRNDKRIGRGTCSAIDECMTDDELWARFGKCRTVRGALAAARKLDRIACAALDGTLS